MDEEIMNFQWFDHVTWDSIKNLRGTTFVQPPTRFKFSLQQAQHAILRAIIHNNPSSSASEPALKALVLSSWLLLGRLAVNASESNCAHFLDARLQLFLAEVWSALWAWFVPTVMSLWCGMPHTEQLHSRSSHEFEKLLHNYVPVKKDVEWQQPETHHQSLSQSRLFKRETVSTQQIQNLQLPHRPLCQTCSCQKSLSSAPPPSAKCHTSQRTWTAWHAR